MPALAPELRRQLENVCIAARDKAEDAARSALQKRAVDAAEPFSHFTAKEKELRNRLRARGRQAGDARKTNKTQEIDQLAQELAYEYWHRMLFARFLAENNLLMHPDGVAVSLDECDELAKTEGAPNGFVLAARYASKMLPQIFRSDDVLLEIEFAPEHRLALEKLLASLPKQTFLADDSLGWVYQFWQSKRKDEVNKSGAKIDGRTLSAVTQLFTEDYMVQFLLHNTIGAWWCGRRGIQGPPGGAGIPAGKSPVAMEYLRWRDDGTPAAGTFDGWPKSFAGFKALDPCCGSGHFLVAAFSLLVPLRMHDEGLSARAACDAVLRENIYGLELDPRCTQIAAFALAVAAWKFPGEDGEPIGYRELPPLNIACTGIGPQATEEEWLRLAQESGLKMTAVSREPILDGLRNLHALFSNAPALGSLIDPNQLSADLITADYETLKPYLTAALTAEKCDEDAHERAVAAAGMVKAAELLAGEYTLVMTNVPFLGTKKQDDILKAFCEERFPEAKADLATCLADRSIAICSASGSVALVTPQNWLFLGTYKKLRQHLLRNAEWNSVTRLGPRSFQTPMYDFNIVLLIISNRIPAHTHRLIALDVGEEVAPVEKAFALQSKPMVPLSQNAQLDNPDERISLTSPSRLPLLSEYVICITGVLNGDSPKFQKLFWEFSTIPGQWVYQQSTVDTTIPFGGRQTVLYYDRENGHLREDAQIRRERLHDSDQRGNSVWGKHGLLVHRMGMLPATLYTGEVYDQNGAVIVPKRHGLLAAIWCFVSSPQYAGEVRKLDNKVGVTPATLAKVPFDLDYWQSISKVNYPEGLPEPFSDDPTQWLFKGDIATSTEPLQVAVGRLLDYRWPDQPEIADGVDKLADSDGIVAFPGVRSERAAAERLLELLHAAYGKNWTDSVLQKLLADAGCTAGTTLDDWLRNQFFDQHCKLFHNRPFIWHIWDGRKDGFSCLVNYHKLDHQALENLAYSYLGDWITAQNAAAKAGRTGADLRLAAAQQLQDKLKLIQAGEPPYDIFVRWKPLSEQAIGWHPDLNDGVRMNIRPFVEAGILRKNPNIKWTKDRGKEPERDRDEFPWFWNGKAFTGDRVNDIHLTNTEKQAARKIAT